MGRERCSCGNSYGNLRQRRDDVIRGLGLRGAVQKQRLKPGASGTIQVFHATVANVQCLRRCHAEGGEGHGEDGGIGLLIASRRTRNDDPKAVGHPQTGQVLGQRAIPVAHHAEHQTHVVQTVKGRQHVVEQVKAQGFHQEIGGQRDGRRSGTERINEHSGALGTQRRQPLCIAPQLHMQAVMAYLEGEGIGHLLLVQRKTGVGHQGGEHRGRWIHTKKRAERVEQDRAHRHRSPNELMDDTDREMGAGDATGGRVRPDHGARADAAPVLYSAAVPGTTSTMPSGTSDRHSHGARGRTRVALIAGAAVVIAWIPSFVATAYSVQPAGEVLANPANGWAFLWDSVTASRNPRLGTPDVAMQEAAQLWAGSPAVAADVSLKSLPSPWTVPVPDGGAHPRAGHDVVAPADPLQWVVQGRVNGGPDQVIGLLDYRTGRVVWDIRPLATAGAAR